MDIERAKEILRTLADGTDPLTGEVLSDDNVCNRVEVVRALHCVLNELETKKAAPQGFCRRTLESRGRKRMT